MILIMKSYSPSIYLSFFFCLVFFKYLLYSAFLLCIVYFYFFNINTLLKEHNDLVHNEWAGQSVRRPSRQLTGLMMSSPGQ